jgi:nitroreductase/NAD-dependent dihydropyrimidine dehydrogenase PreA subunit
MSLFTVDQKECRRDGLCVAECPVKLIEIIGKGGFPTPIDGAEELCINCGHCVSICPHEALSLKTMSPKDCLPVRKELLLSPEHCEHFLRSRRSIRSYKEKRVPRDLLQKLIETAYYAPTSHNSQSEQWLVIEDPTEVRRLGGLVADWMRSLLAQRAEFALSMHMDRVVDSWDKGIDRILRSAPHLVVAHGLSTMPNSQSSCIIALAYLELAAPSLGLGTCWTGYFTAAANFYPPLQEALALPQGHLPYGATMIGYPKYSYQRMPSRNKPEITWR